MGSRAKEGLSFEIPVLPPNIIRDFYTYVLLIEDVIF